MKILHILDHSIPLHSGYTFRTRAILEQQRALGWETFHVTSAKHLGAKNAVEDFDGLRFYRTFPTNGFFNRLPGLNQLDIVISLSKNIDKIVDRLKPDILHAHSPLLTGLAALHIGRKRSLPVIYECRAFWEDAAVDHGTSQEDGLRYRATKALETWVFRRATAVTTICQGLRSDIISRGIPAEKITIIPNAVDIDRFAFNRIPDGMFRRKLGITKKVILGFIGSFYSYEGLLLLLDAMPEMIANEPDMCLLLVGGGPQEGIIKQKVKDLGLEQHVIFTGRVPHDEVQHYYNEVDIFVYPRLSMRLTELVTPLKPLEAMAQGKLVVASDVGGHKELIDDRKTGYIFKAGDPQALSKTVLDLLENHTKWPELREAARTFVESERNWKTSVSNYQNVYSVVLS